jgi:CelD/BcsL family acetyltransferase involved in cellulose biosynthesis
VHQTTIITLLVSCKQAALQLPELWQEAAVLQRLCYKNKNQHRASKHLQAVHKVSQVTMCSDRGSSTVVLRG